MKIELPDFRILQIKKFLNHRIENDAYIHEQNEILLAIERAEKEASGQPYYDNKKIEHIQLNESSLAIVRIFLEKLETLTADERKEILAVIRYLNAPMILVKSNVGQHGKGCECLDCTYLKD